MRPDMQMAFLSNALPIDKVRALYIDIVKYKFAKNSIPSMYVNIVTLSMSKEASQERRKATSHQVLQGRGKKTSRRTHILI